VRQKKIQLPKKTNYLVVDLDDLTADLTLSKYLSDFVKSKNKRPVILLNKQDQFNEFWLRDLLPRWQEIWHPRGVEIIYDHKKKSFLLSKLG